MSTRAKRWIVCRECGEKVIVENRTKYCDNCYHEFQKRIAEMMKNASKHTSIPPSTKDAGYP